MTRDMLAADTAQHEDLATMARSRRKTYQHVLAHAVEQTDAIAVVDQKASWTYGQICSWMFELAREFEKAGLGAGSRIAIWMPNSVEWVVSAAAIDFIGGMIIPVNVRYRPAEIRKLFDLNTPDALIMRKSFLTNDLAQRLESAYDLFKEGSSLSFKVWALPDSEDEPWASAFPSCPDNETSDVGGEWVASSGQSHHDQSEPLVCYGTSGTTGEPKVVLLSSYLLAKIGTWLDQMAFDENDNFLGCFPFSYVAGIRTLLASLIAGGTLIIAQRFTAEEALSLAIQHSATVLMASPKILEDFVAHAAMKQAGDKLRLRKGFFGGVRVPSDFVESVEDALGMDGLVQTYGMTELGGLVTSTSIRDSQVDRSTTVGVPMPGLELEVHNLATGEPCQPGESGELWVRGERSFVGYLEPNGQVLSGVDPAGWYRTGDIFHRRPDGRWVFERRATEIVKIKGENVSLAEVESELLEFQRALRVCAFGLEDGLNGESLAAVIQVRGGSDGASIYHFARRRLAPHKVPKTFWVVSEDFSWPMTPDTGKIRRDRVVSWAVGDSPEAIRARWQVAG